MDWGQFILTLLTKMNAHGTSAHLSVSQRLMFPTPNPELLLPPPQIRIRSISHLKRPLNYFAFSFCSDGGEDYDIKLK